MAYREVHRVESREIIRRWQAGFSQRRIASGTGLSRVTVRRYIAAAEAAGLQPGGPEPSEQQLAQLATLSRTGPRRAEVPSEQLLSPWAEQIERWLQAERLQVTRIHELLAERGCEVSYSTLRRFIARRGWGRRQPVTVRMEDGPPGEVAELDFGRLGLIPDPESGRRRTVWALIVVWRYSRHCFVWPTTSQTLHAVVEGLEAAWACFEGVPRYLVIDNFPAAVAGADALHPRFTRGFLEYARQRGFISDPARVRKPRDKPRVERSVPYVRERLFKGAQFGDLAELRDAARRWSLEVAGQRIHGTTRKRPLEVFQDEERPLLAPWDGEPYEVPDWRTAKVHADHHVACQYALYSVPSALCPPGQQVEVQLGAKLVRIYHRGALLKVHPRQPRGGRATDPNDYPAELSPYTLRAPEQLQRRAAELGEATGAFAAAAGPQAAAPRRALLPRPPRRRLPPRARGRPDRRAPPRAHPRRGPRAGDHAAPAAAAPAAGPLRPPRRRLRTDRHADHDRSVTMTATTAELRPLLKRLKLGPMLDTLPERIALARRDGLDYADFLQIVLADEVSRRDHGRLELRLRQAGFEQLCRLEDFDWSAQVRLDRRLLDAACSLRFLDRREHVLLVGPVGVGKSFLAQALGYAAVRSGHSVRFVTADQYFRELAQARVDHSTEKTFRAFLAPDLLILDDLGLHRLSAQQSIDLYELIIGRHRSSSFVITSNRAVEEWLGLFDDPILGNSALDRLANASYQIVIEGESYRQRLSPHRALLEGLEGGD